MIYRASTHGYFSPLDAHDRFNRDNSNYASKMRRRNSILSAAVVGLVGVGGMVVSAIAGAGPSSILIGMGHALIAALAMWFFNIDQEVRLWKHRQAALEERGLVYDYLRASLLRLKVGL